MKGMIKIICLLLLFSSLSASAQSYLEFVENKGQWKNDIKYQGMMVNGAFALQPSGYRIMLSKAEDMKAVSAFFHGHKEQNETTAHSLTNQTEAPTIHSHSYEVKFLGANENATIIPEKPIETYNNYFIGNDKSKWASNCKIFQAITYKNIYPNIDVRYYTNNNHLKYDIIVNPGGDPNKIAMYFDGVDGLKTKNGDLIIKTSVGEIKELAPYSYQLTKTTKKEVACSYYIKGNIVRFKTEGDIDKSAILVIDPTLIFSTFTGSTVDNWGYTATYDDAGNFYAGGIAFGAGFPVSNGAFQTTFQGGSSNPPYDIAIMKFNSAGTNRIYATYLGGNGDEQPHSLIVDNGGNLIIAGRTNSSNYPVTQPTYGSGGKWDIILTKLNAAGTALIASRKFGGIDDDGVNIRPKYPATTPNAESIRRNYGDDARSEVIIDNSGNIYLASCTQSIDFIKTAGAAQTIPGNTGTGRYQDGVVIKTSPDLANVLFSTLIGGTGDDAAFVLAINPMNNNIYVAGGTTSTDMPGNFTGSIFPTYQGGIADGFMQVLSNDGASFVQSTYLGTNGTDIVYGVQFDKFGYPYVMGTTTGRWPIINAAYNQPGSKHFIAKLKKDLSTWEYSTIFGGTSSEPKISPFAFLVDRCENVYVSGWGGGINQIYVSAQTTTGLPTTPGAIKPTTDGSDMYFFVMERNAASQLYGSFFGQNLGQVGEHVDGGTSRFDKNGVIYQAVCANCEGGAIFPTTPGVWSETNGTGVNGCNLAAIKIAFNLAGVGSGLQSSLDGIPRDTSGCVPLEVLFRDTIAEGKTYIWRFGDGSPDVTTTVPNTSHIYTTVGVYKVMLVSIDSAKCNISDTSHTTMRVRNDDAPLAFDAIKQQPCNALNYNFVNNSIAPAGKPFKSNSFRWD
ncbi:MAG: PKD domain-containing protein, partial [Chitinophagaceae bacterium]|nr:PKD domain-containing protein [Chitinophagaceae bacterium]